MITIIKDFLFDPATAKRFGRYVLFIVGAGIQQGIIPTGISGGGKFGVFISGMALLISSQPNNKEK